MTVQELIESLKGLDPSALMVVETDDGRVPMAERIAKCTLASAGETHECVVVVGADAWIDGASDAAEVTQKPAGDVQVGDWVEIDDEALRVRDIVRNGDDVLLIFEGKVLDFLADELLTIESEL